MRQNLLLDGKSHTLKICDFGTAKRMIHGEQPGGQRDNFQLSCGGPALAAWLRVGPRQRPYMVSRYYRAPELILGVWA